MDSAPQLDAGDFFLLAIIRVYTPWTTSAAVPPDERRLAARRVEHARSLLKLRGVTEPETIAYVQFNQQEES